MKDLLGVVTDLGDTVVWIAPAPYLAFVAEATKLSGLSASLYGLIFAGDGRYLLDRFERDEIDDEAYVSGLETIVSARLMPRESYWQAHVDAFERNEPVIALYREVKMKRPDVRLVACSDTDRRRLPWMLGLVGLHFDGHVASFMCQALKPDPKMYAKACACSKAAAHELLFVDDRETNVAGAAAFGMKVHHYDPQNPRRDILLRKTLESYGLL